MKKLQWQAALLSLVIIIITGFQLYWLRDNYYREKQALLIRMDGLFNETVRNLQDSLFEQRWKSLIAKDSDAAKEFSGENFNLPVKLRLPYPVQIIDQISEHLVHDSSRPGPDSRGVVIAINAGDRKNDSLKIDRPTDSFRHSGRKEMFVVKAGETREAVSDREPAAGKEKRLTLSQTIGKGKNGHTEINTIYFDNGSGNRYKVRIDSLIGDLVSISSLDTAYRKILIQNKLDIPFTIRRQKAEFPPGDSFMTRPDNIIPGFKLLPGSTFPFIMRRIVIPIFFSIFLVGVTVFAFVLLYRSLRKQQRLAQMKNDLISNITHELKTPIATVAVAIEALKNFNAMQDPLRSKEYLDISQNELQRLGLLVDKVLKLSMFENKKMELRQEVFDLADAVNEVVASLRLQAEKCQATISVDAEGDFMVRGDRLHLLSVIFNLLDNALKYCRENPRILISLREDANHVVMKVSDNGMGIPTEYHEKIFEKFFRVPAGDTHNAKGHGLGLSYIRQVVQQHGGIIAVESREGAGSSFSIRLPKNIGQENK